MLQQICNILVNDPQSLKQFFHCDLNILTHPPSTIDNDLVALDFRPNNAGRGGTNTFDLYFFRRFNKLLSSAMLEIVDFVEIDDVEEELKVERDGR
jgi:hypothetical protein